MEFYRSFGGVWLRMNELMRAARTLWNFMNDNQMREFFPSVLVANLNEYTWRTNIFNEFHLVFTFRLFEWIDSFFHINWSINTCKSNFVFSPEWASETDEWFDYYFHIRYARIEQKSSGWFSFDANTHLFAGKPPAKGTEFGCSALPNFENEFQQNFQRTLEYAKALNCKK